MSSGCAPSRASRTRFVSSIVVLAMLTTPVVGAMVYLGATREAHARDEVVSTSDIELPAEGGDWVSLATSTLDGGSFAMRDLFGKPAVLYFWATWCPQCKIQREVLNTLSHAWGDRLRIVVIDTMGRVQSVSSGLMDAAKLRRFVAPLLPCGP